MEPSMKNILDSIGSLYGYKTVTWCGWQSKGKFEMHNNKLKHTTLEKLNKAWRFESAIGIIVRVHGYFFSFSNTEIHGFLMTNSSFRKLGPQEVEYACETSAKTGMRIERECGVQYA